tara:strand:- start:84 stop:293 length:210 start_codon:yes stop_codon:yes gene_type:complete
MKYKNKDGIELNIGGMSDAGRIGGSMDLVQEIVSESIKILDMHDKNCMTSIKMAINNTKKFLRQNFDIK